MMTSSSDQVLARSTIGSTERRPVHIVHLMASCVANHGPTGGILAQIEADRSGRRRWSVWSMYPPEGASSAEQAVRQAGASWHQFGMSRPFFDLRILAPLIRRLRAERPDVLHCHLVRANLYGRVAARLAGVPVVISTLRNVEDYFLGRDPVARAVRWVEHATTRLVSRYVAVSEGVRTAAIAHLGLRPDQISTILNAVDLRPFASPRTDRIAVRAEFGFEAQHTVIGTASVLEPRKNITQLLRAVRVLGSEFPGVRLLIVGSGPAEAELRAGAAALGLNGVVQFAGFRADVPRVLNAFDLFALASHNEGLPRAVMEAMAAGLPCVVTDVGGNAEAVRHGQTGFVVAPGAERVFIESLRALVGDVSRRRDMGEAGRRRAFAEFAPERMARDYGRLYVELLARANYRAPKPD
jgi:glycosyltransferase involved in cell wall biosynthesis